MGRLKMVTTEMYLPPSSFSVPFYIFVDVSVPIEHSSESNQNVCIKLTTLCLFVNRGILLQFTVHFTKVFTLLVQHKIIQWPKCYVPSLNHVSLIIFRNQIFPLNVYIISTYALIKINVTMQNLNIHIILWMYIDIYVHVMTIFQSLFFAS